MSSTDENEEELESPWVSDDALQSVVLDFCVNEDQETELHVPDDAPPSPTGEPAHGLPHEVLSQAVGKSKFHASIAQHLVGTYGGEPASLLVFRFAFGRSRRHRIHEASISVFVEEAEPQGTTPDGSFRPRILKPLDPLPTYLGVTEQVDVERNATAQFSLGTSAVGAGGTLSIGEVRRYCESSEAAVYGQTYGRPPFQIEWTLEENAVRRQGVARELRVALVVGYASPRRFRVRVAVAAELGFLYQLIYARAAIKSRRDEPMYFDPEDMKSQALAASPPRDFADEDLEQYTHVVFAGEESQGFRTLNG